MKCMICGKDDEVVVRLESYHNVHPKCLTYNIQKVAEIQSTDDYRIKDIFKKWNYAHEKYVELQDRKSELELIIDPPFFYRIFHKKGSIPNAEHERDNVVKKMNALDHTTFHYKAAYERRLKYLENERIRIKNEYLAKQPSPSTYKADTTHIPNISDFRYTHSYRFRRRHKKRKRDRFKQPLNPEGDWARLRDRVFSVKGRYCSKCGSDNDLEVHHIRPIKFGGTNDIDNLEVLCDTCHHRRHRKRKFDYSRIPDDHYGQHKGAKSEKASSIYDAIEHHRNVYIVYINAEGEKTERLVTPKKIYTEGYGRIYMRGYCHLRNDKRTFRVARIQSLTVK